MITGTSHFISLNTAIRYYEQIGEDITAVKNKIKEKSIHIGPPKLKKGQELIRNIQEGRYFIEE